MSAWSWFALGWALAALIMAALWLVQRRTGNAGIVDVAWAACIGLLAVLFAAVAPGHPWMRVLAAAMGGVWGLRLALHIHRRSHGRPEDGRYQQLRREWGADVQRRMFRFYQMQAAASAFFALPFLFLAWNAAAPGAIAATGAALWLAGVLGETTADRQLEAFKRSGPGRGAVCRRGLWRYSRHPNYFFEWLTWCGIALAATTAPFGAIAWACPVAMLILLFRFTGIPATEAQAIRTKGDAYRLYQRQTSAFVPWFPRSEA